MCLVSTELIVVGVVHFSFSFQAKFARCIVILIEKYLPSLFKIFAKIAVLELSVKLTNAGSLYSYRKQSIMEA